MVTGALLFVVGAIVIGAITTYMFVAIHYYLTKLIEVKKIKRLINEIQEEYNNEINKLYSQFERGKVEIEQLAQKEAFITDLYLQMFDDLQEKFTKQYDKERIRLRWKFIRFLPRQEK